MAQKHECPTCDVEMPYVEAWPLEMRGSPGSSTFTVPVASDVYQCPECEQYFRIGIDGSIQRVERKKD
jgi:hypothetical protein